MSTVPHPETGGAGAGENDSNRYWNEWNRQWRFRDDYDFFMQRQLDTAIRVAKKAGIQSGRILDLGCGTGWLGNALLPFGEVWGTDLSPDAVESGKQRHPQLKLLCGDFMTLPLEGPFDLIVSADSFVHMPHEACLRRIHDLLAPGGCFLLMTQNPAIWKRRSKLRSLPDTVPNADPRDWPTVTRMLSWLRPLFRIQRITSLDPGGDTGILFWVESGLIRRVMERLVGKWRWIRLLEIAGFGREVVIVARRR